MAAGFLFMWACGYAMTTLVEDDSPLEEILFGLHISVGVTLLALLAARIGVRIARKPPPLPKELSRIERTGAVAGHAALYALPALVIACGWGEVDLGGHGVRWFGVDMPKVFPTFEPLEETAESMHRWLAYTMLGVAAIHVAAVAKHRWIDRRDVLHRMTFGRR